MQTKVYDAGCGGAAGYFRIEVLPKGQADELEGGRIDGEAVSRRTLAGFFRDNRREGGISRRVLPAY
jgi:hypothetical protein